jgi:carboxymethylenebutenolidase
MCHDPTDRPPLPPIADGAGMGGTEDLILEATDGNRLLAFAARAAADRAPGVVILPDVRGLHPFYADLAVRFAEAGVHATALDFFGRTAGIGDRGEDFEFRPHVQQVTTDGVRADVEAGIADLRSAGAERVFSVGFCMGGRLAFNTAAQHDLAGVVGFYGGPQGRGPDDERAPIRLAPGYRCPVLGLFGGADEGIPREEIEWFRHALDEAGVANELVIYDGAPHSFFDRSFEEHRDACEDAWRRVLALVGQQGA